MKLNIRQRRLGRFFIGVLLLGGAPLFAVACHNRHDPEKRIEKMAEHIKDKLELNDQQAMILAGARDEAIALSRDFRAERSASIAQLETLLRQPQVDQAALTAMYEKRRALTDKHMPVIIAKLAELHKTLNDGQRAELLESLEKAKKWLPH